MIIDFPLASIRSAKFRRPLTEEIENGSEERISNVSNAATIVGY